MNKVISINLHGRAYQIEETGYGKLKVYLDQAAERLAHDPDKDEIIADLEQGLAEKLEHFLTSAKNVITDREIDEALRDMGPVTNSTEEKTNDSNNTKKDGTETNGTQPKHLYRIRDGAMITGVCTGIAAYFNIDVTLVRVAFVILTALTHGLAVLIYILMTIVVPEANTSAKKAQAAGLPFTAEDFINRAHTEYRTFSEKFTNQEDWKTWKQNWKQKAREEKRAWKMRTRYATPFSPLFGLISTILTVLWVWGLVSIITSGIVFGILIPASIPLWIAIVLWVMLFQFVMWPLKAGRSMAHGAGAEYQYENGFIETVTWLSFLALVSWVIWHYIPASHGYAQHVLDWLSNTISSWHIR